MKSHRSRCPHVLVLILGCLLVHPMPVESACSVGTPMVMTYATFRQVKKDLMPASVYGCRLNASMNVGFCFPSNMASISNSITELSATASLGTTDVSCSWRCYCNTTMTMSFTAFDIDGGDGLPVELMDFGFEDDES